MSWERLLRVLRIHRVVLPEVETENAALALARKRVERLHRRAERVLADYAAADHKRGTP